MKSKNQKILEMSRKQDVQPDELAEYIYSKINFTLPHNIWIGINNGYAEFYNSLSNYDSFYEMMLSDMYSIICLMRNCYFQ